MNVQTTLEMINPRIESLPAEFNYPYPNDKVYKSVMLRIYGEFSEKEFTLIDVVKKFENEISLSGKEFLNHLKFMTQQKWLKQIATRDKSLVYTFCMNPNRWKYKSV